MITGTGTSEDAWLPFLQQLDVPPLSLPTGRVVVAGAHPDDEVLAAGGMLAVLAAAGREVRVLVATDGGASHPGSPTLSPAQLERTRRAEGAAALAALGLDAPVALGLPDGSADELEDPVAAALEGLLRPDDVLVSLWEHDGHPDHEAVGRAAVRAATSAGVRLLALPVWTWHWAQPDDPRVPWTSARRLDLTPEQQRRKAAAVACHASQLAPLSPAPQDVAVLPPPVLARFQRPVEVVLEVRR